MTWTHPIEKTLILRWSHEKGETWLGQRICLCFLSCIGICYLCKSVDLLRSIKDDVTSYASLFLAKTFGFYSQKSYDLWLCSSLCWWSFIVLSVGKNSPVGTSQCARLQTILSPWMLVYRKWSSTLGEKIGIHPNRRILYHVLCCMCISIWRDMITNCDLLAIAKRQSQR